MKWTTAVAASLLALGAAMGSAAAQDRPNAIAPPKTLGDEGKLPPTQKGATPEMGATAPVEIGPQKRMGDQGPLPATKGMSGATPEMTAPAAAPPAKE